MWLETTTAKLSNANIMLIVLCCKTYERLDFVDAVDSQACGKQVVFVQQNIWR